MTDFRHLTHPIKASQVLHFVFIARWLVVDHSVLLVYTARLKTLKHMKMLRKVSEV